MVGHLSLDLFAFLDDRAGVGGEDVAPDVLCRVQRVGVLWATDTVGEVAGVMGDDQQGAAWREQVPRPG